MYIPKHYLNSNDSSAVEFMQQYSFATMVTAVGEFPTATHLPFQIEWRNDKIILTSHMAKANPQAQLLTAGKLLVIFAEPHAYISPKHYEKELNVPTWNYVSVHAYGNAKIIDGKEEAFEVLEKMIDSFEASYREQWDRLPDNYKSNMVTGITAFEIEVTELQAKNKLSQNKRKGEKERIIEALSKSEVSTERAIADMMKRNS